MQLTLQAWIYDYAPSMGAALSYYTIFSLPPLLLIVISIAGLLFGADAARGSVVSQLATLMGDSAAHTIEGLLATAQRPANGAVGTLIGGVTLLIGATTVFGELQDALDRIWRAPAQPAGTGLWGLVRRRLLAFGMIGCIAFLLMVSLVAGAVVAAMGRLYGGFFGDWHAVAQAVDIGLGFALTTVGFALIYKIIPRVQVRWHDVWLGAAVTALLFTVGKFVIGLYVARSGVTTAFGAYGSLVVVLVWVYYSAQIFLLGAEFTSVYARTQASLRAAGDPAPETERSPARQGRAARRH